MNYIWHYCSFSLLLPLVDTSCSVRASILHWRPSTRIRRLSFPRQEMVWLPLARPGALPPSTAVCTQKWRCESSRAHLLYCWWWQICSTTTNQHICPFFFSLQITHPAGCMSQFIQFFGEQIMVLWKFALLRKRILIFSPPPVGVVCYRGEKLKHTLALFYLTQTGQGVINVLSVVFLFSISVEMLYSLCSCAFPQCTAAAAWPMSPYLESAFLCLNCGLSSTST